jgi:hypothetical protein
MTELHRCKAMLGIEHATAIEYTKAQALARAITATINQEGTPHPTFPRASQNVAATTMRLDTVPATSTDGVDKVYHHLKGILGIAAEQQAESLLQWRAKGSILSIGRSKAS